MEKGWKTSAAEISPSCPRCGSSNTKFCYYNNYSLTQPRYFCKGCRRYWTKGGSLRNVPVGGGCRKNRRGRPLRLSTDRVLHSNNSLGYGGLCNVSIRNPYRGVSSAESSSPSTNIQDGSHIDLALVYAKFVNPLPESKNGLEVPAEQPANRFDPSLEFDTISNTNFEPSTARLSEENCRFPGHLAMSETPSSDNDHLMYYYGSLDSTQKHQEDDHHKDRTQQCTNSYDTSHFDQLPPLPEQQNMGSLEILWTSTSNSHGMMDNHALQMPQQPLLLGSEVQDSNLLFGNWSPSFDLPSAHDDTFLRSNDKMS